MANSRKWMIKTSSARLLTTAAIVEIAPSLCLWALSPTDSVRVWYPSVWSYVGEHFLPWCLALSALLKVVKPFQKRAWPANPSAPGHNIAVLSLREYLGFAGLLFAADASASFFLVGWWWQRNASFTTSMIYTRSFIDYLCSREPAVLVALVLVGISLNRPLRRSATSWV